MKKSLIAILVFMVVGCGGVQPTAMFSPSGNPVHMNGYLITVKNVSADDYEYQKAVDWVNSNVGWELLTTTTYGDSVIWIQERQLYYCVPEIDEDCQESQLEKTTFFVPDDGVVYNCIVTVNTLIPDKRTKVQALAHGMFHCLGLVHDTNFNSIMNPYSISNPFSKLNEEDRLYLEALYDKPL